MKIPIYRSNFRQNSYGINPEIYTTFECSLADEEEGATTPSPPRLFYDVEVRLVNLGDGYRAPLPGSPDFEDISNTIAGSFSPALAKVPGFHQLKLSELRK